MDIFLREKKVNQVSREHLQAKNVGQKHKNGYNRPIVAADEYKVYILYSF